MAGADGVGRLDGDRPLATSSSDRPPFYRPHEPLKHLAVVVPSFDEKHLAHVGDWPGLQAVQIHAAGDVLAALVAAIPMGGAGASQVLTRCSVAHIDFPDQSSPDVVYRQATGAGAWS